LSILFLFSTKKKDRKGKKIEKTNRKEKKKRKILLKASKIS
jgi:hypothetical protein